MTRRDTIPIADRTLIFTLNSGGRLSGTRRNLLRNHDGHKPWSAAMLPTEKSHAKPQSRLRPSPPLATSARGAKVKQSNNGIATVERCLALVLRSLGQGGCEAGLDAKR